LKGAGPDGGIHGGEGRDGGAGGDGGTGRDGGEGRDAVGEDMPTLGISYTESLPRHDDINAQHQHTWLTRKLERWVPW
jgi:hypothetical protein